MAFSPKDFLHVHGHGHTVTVTVKSGKQYKFDLSNWKFFPSGDEGKARKTATHAATELIQKWNRDNPSGPIEGDNYSHAMQFLEGYLFDKIMAITRHHKDHQRKTEEAE